jgi:hypothetical protein
VKQRSLVGSALAAALAPSRAWLSKVRYELLVKRSGLPIYRVPPADRMATELAHVDILRRMTQEHPWMPNAVFPVGGAATHAFLAILARALMECRFNKVLELGAGQTTRLLSAWSNTFGAKVWTLENDEHWADEARSAVSSPSHTIVHAPLRADENGHFWYDAKVVRAHLANERVDLIIVDGPVGTRRWSRAGVIERFTELRAEEWVVLWDDLQRQGDLESFAAFIGRLRDTDIPHGVACCQGSRTLGLVFSPEHRRLKHFC